MKVLIATPLYPPELGGPATYSKLLEDALPRNGIEVVLAKFSEVKAYPKGVRHFLYYLMLRRLLRDADVVLALDPVSVGLPAALAAKHAKKPLIVKVVGDYAWEQSTQRTRLHLSLDEFVTTKHIPLLIAFFRRIQRYVAREARTVLVPSIYLKSIVSTWGIAPEKIAVVYNAVEPTYPGTLDPSLKNRSRPRIVTAGRLVPWKRIGGIIDALVLVHETLPSASLTVIGDGPEREALEQYAATRVSDTCHFLGPKTHEETLAILKDADVFVLNSTYEGLSHLLIESLSLGLPTVATRVGGNPELITDKENGLLTESGDTKALAEALVQVLLDAELAERLRAAASHSAARFSVSNMVEGTIRVLQSKEQQQP